MLGGVVGGLAEEALARPGETGIQVRRVRKRGLRITGHARKAKRLAGPVTSGKRGMGNFCGTRKSLINRHFIYLCPSRLTV